MPRVPHFAATLLLALTACGGPIGIIPGEEISGEDATTSTWSEVVADSGTLELETRPADPYSVRIGYVYRDANVYIDPAEERAWYQNINADPSVRVRFDDRVCRARAVAVRDARELEGFDPERHVLRLELVNPAPATPQRD